MNKAQSTYAGAASVEGRLMMMELQADELQALLIASENQRNAACRRASNAERQNKALRERLRSMEEDLAIIGQCWNCDNLGQRDCCRGCANRSVFEKIRDAEGS